MWAILTSRADSPDRRRSIHAQLGWERITTFLMLVLVLLSATSGLAYAQVQLPTPPTPPRPAPVQRLGYFVGTWLFLREDLVEPKGKYEGTVTWKWFPGDVSIIGLSEGTSPQGASIDEMAVLGYSPSERERIGQFSGKNAYVCFAVGRGGPGREVKRFSVDGRVWTSESPLTRPDGKPSMLRSTITEVSTNVYTYTVEGSLDGSSWTRIIDVRATRMR